MPDKKPVNSLTDPNNVLMTVVDKGPEKEGMTVENAYRHLVGIPPEPVDVPEEI
jgi:hypothetical protein